MCRKKLDDGMTFESYDIMTSCIAAVRKIYEGDIAHMEDALRKCGYF